MEHLLVPYHAVKDIPAETALVFAPHPDDEVFGCGGAIMRHVEAGVRVRVIVVSDGGHGLEEGPERVAYVAQRQEESRRAASVLGYAEPVFWDWRDREIGYGEKLVRDIQDAIQEAGADLVYAPSVFEMHPDHRAVGMAAVEAVRRIGTRLRVALYEVGIPLHPNLLLDISELAERKMQAMQCFVSQLQKQRYDLDIAALDRYRTYTLPPEVTAAEAYILLSADELANDPLKLYQSEHRRQKELGLALGAEDVPLVSVIIRSMDRPTLSEALDSVALQTYPNIEVVLVNAKGAGHRGAGEWCGRFPLRMVEGEGPMARSRAANAGLESAAGQYLLFLDDDDWFAPRHIASLVDALSLNPGKRVAYGCVACADENRQLTARTYCKPFDRTQLLAGNYIPIHALLFSRSIVDAGCRVDESFDLYEDWDFLLQAAEFGDFVFVEQIGAYYRIGNQFGQGVRPDVLYAQEVTARLLEKWRSKWRKDDLQKLMANIREADAKVHTEIAARDAVAAERDAAIAEKHVAIAEREAAIAGREALLASTSWRVTRPLRFIGYQVRRIGRFIHAAWRWIEQNEGILNATRKLLSVLSQHGWSGLKSRIRTRSEADLANALVGKNYREWVSRYDSLSDAGRAQIQAAIERLERKPRFSILMPTYNSKPEWLEDAIESVQRQLYPNWELCIADDASTAPGIRPILERYAHEDSRIKVVFRESNGHISAATNSAFALATGEYVALLDHDDILAEHALFWVAEAINGRPEAGLIYSDEDKLDEDGRRYDPYFKCDWNYDLFLSHNLITHLGVYRADLVRGVGGCREGYEGAQDYDLALRVVERLRREQIVHIPRVLYHWRAHAASTSKQGAAKPYAWLAGERALNSHLARMGTKARAELLPEGHYRVHYDLPSSVPHVTLIIPTRNGLALIRQCVDSILEKTSYPNYDILIVDNGSDDPAVLAYFEALKGDKRIRILRDERPFNFSALNNLAVTQAKGELIGLINNDIEVITPDWLTEMASIAIQPGVGAVGARLWYPNDTLQHGGVVLVGGVAGHSHKGLAKGLPGYAKRAVVLQSFSAVTAACLLIRKTIYQEAGGLDETNLKVAFNDVDFCLKVRELGYRNVWTPYAELYHYESATRGYEETPEKRSRFDQETVYMKKRWGALLLNDPAYSPNLTLDREDFSFAWPPRTASLTDGKIA
ncbi:MAG: glycosyltransferase [Sulfuricellaceae bacterium]|nr:glycosyltransferase [Sulfuricellaceae bacterium]